MKKIYLIIIFVLVGIIGISSCKTMENNNDSLKNFTFSHQTSKNNVSLTSENNTTLDTRNESINSKISFSSKEESINSKISFSSKEESSKTADEKMYEYVRSHQVTTKKVTNMANDEVLKFTEKMLSATSSCAFNLPDSLIFTEGTIECVFDQTHVLSNQAVNFKDLVGEFNANELQDFLSQLPQKRIKKQGDESNSVLVLPMHQELFNTQKNSTYISLFGSRKNTFNASLGTAIISILIYEKSNEKYSFRFNSTLNNPDYLIGKLEIQPDGSAKIIG